LIKDHPDLVKRNRIQQVSALPKGWIAHPEFPQLSYLEMRVKEPSRQVKPRELAHWVWLAVEWNDLFRHAWDEVEEAARTSSPIWRSDSVEVVPLCIQWSWRDDDIIEAFRQWLKEKRPKGEEWDGRPRMDEPPPEPKDRGGAGSPIRQMKAKLKALAAWRLIQHYNGNHVAAYERAGAKAYLGKQFGMPGAWSEARATVRNLLEEALLPPKPLILIHSQVETNYPRPGGQAAEPLRVGGHFT
jgi:hypothetical protein